MGTNGVFAVAATPTGDKRPIGSTTDRPFMHEEAVDVGDATVDPDDEAVDSDDVAVDSDDAIDADDETVDADDVAVDFGDDGLVVTVAQDAESGTVLMVAYVSPEALSRTRETGIAHYHSRSRDALWRKGDTSGHVQHVEEIRVDCDADALLYLVHQEGGACHTGHRSCFYRTVDGQPVGDRVFDPADVYE